MIVIAECSHAVVQIPACYSFYSEFVASEIVGQVLSVYVKDGDRLILPERSLILQASQLTADLLPGLAKALVVAAATGWAKENGRDIMSFWLSDFGAFILWRKTDVYADWFYYNVSEIGASQFGLGKVAAIVSHQATGLYKILENSLILATDHGSYLFKPDRLRNWTFNELITAKDLEVQVCKS